MDEVIWIKLYTGLFENKKLKFIEVMKNRDSIVCILIKLCLQAAKTNDKGLIYFNKNKAYTNEMLSIIFNRPLDAIEEAIEVLSDFRVIEIDKNNFIKIRNWEKYQNVESMERVKKLTRDRVRKHRAKKKEDNCEKLESTSDLNMQISEDLNCDKTEESPLDFSNESDLNINDDESNIEINNDDIFHAKNCNVTVTQQKEKKIKNKNEIKNKSKKESENTIKIKNQDKRLEKNNVQLSKIAALECIQEVNADKTDSKSLSPEVKKQKNLKAATELFDYYKNNSIKVIGLNLPALKSCISIHGKDYSKLAIDKALKLNKPDMKYINGILKNWEREGYPVLETAENIKGKSGSKLLKFNNFKPREYDYDSLEKALLGWD